VRTLGCAWEQGGAQGGVLRSCAESWVKTQQVAVQGKAQQAILLLPHYTHPTPPSRSCCVCMTVTILTTTTAQQPHDHITTSLAQSTVLSATPAARRCGGRSAQFELSWVQAQQAPPPPRQSSWQQMLRQAAIGRSPALS
jgi:hypothetical protein